MGSLGRIGTVLWQARLPEGKNFLTSKYGVEGGD